MLNRRNQIHLHLNLDHFASHHSIKHYHCYNLDRKSTRLNSSHVRISYAVFCLKKKRNTYLPTAPARLDRGLRSWFPACCWSSPAAAGVSGSCTETSSPSSQYDCALVVEPWRTR